MLESNQRMPESKSGALPLGEWPRKWWRRMDLNHRALVGTRFTVWRDRPLCHTSEKWTLQQDSNLRTPPYEDGALPAEPCSVWCSMGESNPPLLGENQLS